MKAIIFLALLTSSISPLSFEDDKKNPKQQRELLMCLQSENVCACCDEFFGKCRRQSLFSFVGVCHQSNMYIYETQYAQFRKSKKTAKQD